MFSIKPSSSKDNDARTSSDDDVTPPLLAEASLNNIQPAFSSVSLASWVMKRLAPSTMYGIVHLPSTMRRLAVERSIDSGRPPHGTNKSNGLPSRRWNVLRNVMPLLISSPLGNLTPDSSTSTR